MRSEIKTETGRQGGAGLTGWLLERLKARLRPGARNRPRLALLERIALAPKQSLSLVEAEGRRFLVATSGDGASAFYALDERGRTNLARPGTARLSW
jgi:flagellar biogenesis protein FliO